MGDTPGPPGSCLVISNKKRNKKRATHEHTQQQQQEEEEQPQQRVQHGTRNARVSLTAAAPVALLDVYDTLHALRATPRRGGDPHNNNNNNSSSSSGRGNKRAGGSDVFACEFAALPYPRGIHNASNFCFMNAVLQALVFAPPFAQLAVSVAAYAHAHAPPRSQDNGNSSNSSSGNTRTRATPSCATLVALGNWFAQYWRGGAATSACMRPPSLPVAMTRTGYVDGSAQHDAQEFVQKMLEAINAELVALEAYVTRAHEQQEQQRQHNGDGGGATSAKQPKRRGKDASHGGKDNDSSSGGATSSATHVNKRDEDNDMRGWTIVQGRRDTASVREHVSDEGRSLLLAAVLGGATESQLRGTSRRAAHASVLIEHFYSLPVDVGFAAECTLEEALQRSCGTERVYDDGRNRELRKTVLLRRLPQLLLLHLRRWAVTAEGELVKLSNVVHYSRTLVLPASVCASDDSSNSSGGNDNKAATRRARTYRLLSVIAHRGEAAGRGHYVTYLVRHVASPLRLSSPSARGGGSGACALPCDDMVVLCNDASVTLCRASEMHKDTAYFLVYQKA